MRRLVARTLPAVLVATSAACRAVGCPPPEPTHSAVAWQFVGGARGRVDGIALAIRDGRPLAAAKVRVTPGDTAWRRVGADGRFVLKLSPGVASTIEVSAPRYGTGSLVLGVRSDSAIALVASLARSRAAPANPSCGRASQPSGDTLDEEAP